jgi:hypothetical protein
VMSRDGRRQGRHARIGEEGLLPGQRRFELARQRQPLILGGGF